jgi:hypothetical protein
MEDPLIRCRPQWPQTDRENVRVGQPGPQHHKFVLPFTLHTPAGATHRIVETAQLALGPGVHIPQSGDNRMRLVIQIQRIAHQLLEIDVGSKVTKALRTVSTAIPTTTFSAAIPATLRAASALRSASSLRWAISLRGTSALWGGPS